MTPPAPLKLPYFRDAAELPGPLPDPLEIRNTPKSDLTSRRNAWEDRAGMCLIRDIYVVKFGIDVTENEGNALIFIEKHLKIPAPRLCAMYRDVPSGPLYLVMEYIHGVDLESVWKSLSVETKSSIAMQLRSMFTQMRSFSPPQDFIGGICGGSMPEPVFGTYSPDAAINGPFRTAEEVGLALALASRNNWEQNGRHSWISGFFLRQLPMALKDYGVKLTHGDLHMRNILVEKVPSEHGSEGTRVKAEKASLQSSYRVRGIVDWESAGWYPSYWEYASAVARFQSDSDWLESLDNIIEPYQLEALAFMVVLQDLQYI